VTAVLEDTRPVIEAKRQKFRLTYHAINRARQMGVPAELIPHILANGVEYDAPERSKYAGCYVVRAGKVAVAINPLNDEIPAIVTVLWATVDAWREADHKAGREYRGDGYARSVLRAWFGEDL
jgi:hypothetical protein